MKRIGQIKGTNSLASNSNGHLSILVISMARGFFFQIFAQMEIRVFFVICFCIKAVTGKQKQQSKALYWTFIGGC